MTMSNDIKLALAISITLILSGCGGGNTKHDNNQSRQEPVDTNVPTPAPGNEGNLTLATNILKTGQTTSYADYDDGYYETGVARSYTRNDAEEVVTDNATGLMWQDNSEVRLVDRRWVTQDNYNMDKYNDTTGDTAISYCHNLTLGGYGDWRLPSRNELASIIDFSRHTPSINPIFLNAGSYGYWSSTPYASDSKNAWSVSFGYGNQHPYLKNKSFGVRCVRGKLITTITKQDRTDR